MMSVDRTGPYRIDAMIGGVEKGGTTSLGSYLAGHPRILSHFGRDTEPDRIEFSAFVQSGIVEDFEAYRRMFLETFGRRAADDEMVVGKSVGILHLPEAAKRLFRLNPECRVIFSLRDPVERAYSAYWWQRYRGVETADSFEEALALEMDRESEGVWEPDRMYVGKGRYVEHLRRVVALFGRDQVKVLTLDDLRDRPQHTVNRIVGFLGLPQMDVKEPKVRNRAKRPRWPWLAQLIQGEGAAKSIVRRCLPRRLRKSAWRWLRRVNAVEDDRPPMRDETRSRLHEYFHPYNRELEEFLGVDLNAWKH